jgi:hypothetical protein
MSYQNLLYDQLLMRNEQKCKSSVHLGFRWPAIKFARLRVSIKCNRTWCSFGDKTCEQTEDDDLFCINSVSAYIS